MFDLIKTYKSRVLLWSAGLDSTLLLAMLREANVSADIVQFGREFWTKEQKKRADELIKLWDLKVLSYPPIRTSFIGDDTQISLVREYAFMDTVMPMVSDIIEGSRCIADLDGYKAYAPPAKWDLVILGSRAEDGHYAFPQQVIPSEIWTRGATTFYAPFYNKTREWVKDGLRSRDLPCEEVADEIDSGNISLCTKCLNGVETLCPATNSLIPPVRWDAVQNLAAFRAAYA